MFPRPLAILSLAFTLCLPALGAHAATVGAKAPAPTAASLDLDQLIDGVEAFYAKVTDFKASFKQVVIRNHLPRPLKKSGTVYFKTPGMMRWDYTQPDKVYYISDGKILWSYQPADRLVYKLRIQDGPLYNALKFLFGQGNLRKDFHTVLGKPDGGQAALVLTPKVGGGVAPSNFKSLTLFVDPATFRIVRTALVDPLGNVSRISFQNPTYKPLKAKGFQFTPPAGVRIEDMAARATGGR